MLRTPLGPARRVFVPVILAVVLAACSSHHGGGRAGTTTTAHRTPSGLAEEIVAHPCDVLDRAALSRATGLTLRVDSSVPDMCGYISTDESASVPVRFAPLGSVHPALAVSTSTATCDAGSVSLVHLGGDEGFVCSVQGVATVGATGHGVYGLLSFGSLASDTPKLPVLKGLVMMLHDALQ